MEMVEDAITVVNTLVVKQAHITLAKKTAITTAVLNVLNRLRPLSDHILICVELYKKRYVTKV